MLEIILLFFLCRRLGEILRAKGRSPGWYQFLLVVLWFGGELFGAIVTVAVFQVDGLALYLGAILGAAGGALLAFVIANSIPPMTPLGPPGFAVIQPTRAPDRSEL